MQVQLVPANKDYATSTEHSNKKYAADSVHAIKVNAAGTLKKLKFQINAFCLLKHYKLKKKKIALPTYLMS